MMRRLAIALILLALAGSASAQKVPFKLPNAQPPKPPAPEAPKAEEPKAEEPAPQPAPAPQAAPPAPSTPQQVSPPKSFPAAQAQLPPDLAFRERSSEIYGQRIAWFEIGEGPVVVLLHGLAGDRRDWVPLMRRLSANHRVVALDAPGFGDSAKPAIRYEIGTLVDFLDAFLREQRIEHPLLVGHSTGAWAAAQYASAPGASVDRLVLVAPAGIGSANAALAALLVPSTREAMRTLVGGLYAKAGATPDEAALDAAFARALARGDRAATEDLIAASREDTGFATRMRAIGVPTLILRGGADRMIPQKDAERYRELIAGSGLQVLAGCGHMAHIECADEVAAALAGFSATR